MQQFELDYARLVEEILVNGEVRETRNGRTKSMFGKSLYVSVTNIFPILQGRKMYPAGTLGEFAALVRRPQCVADFEEWGCNYWDLWADVDNNLILDYGNAWFDFEGYDQVAELKRCLVEDPTNRRMIINSWRPNRLADLSLPCCHYSYQFYVRDGHYLDMIWTQRSVDMMIGLPADFILAATFLISLAHEFGFAPGVIKFDLGDCHIYNEHWGEANTYLARVRDRPKGQYTLKSILYVYDRPKGADFCTFEPTHLQLGQYKYLGSLTFKLKE